MSRVFEEFHSAHHFTTAYSPWSNGTVEHVYTEVLRACTALWSEWKLSAQDWPAVIEILKSIVNHAPLRRLGLRSSYRRNVFRSPLEVFTGHKQRRPLIRALPPSNLTAALMNDGLRAAELIRIEELKEVIEKCIRML